MDLNWLQDILCLENTRSFTQAALQRNVTQSALSRRVKALETWLDATLVDRTSYPIRLTPAGDLFLPVARKLLAQVQQTREDFKESKQIDERVFRIAAPHSVASHFLARRLAALHRADPGLQTRVFSDNVVICFDLLSQGVCEFLLSYRYPPIPMALDESLFNCTDIGTERLVPVADRAMAEQCGWAFPGSAANPLPLLGYDGDSFLGSVVSHLLASRPERLHLRTRHTDAFAEAVRGMCRGGAGIAWLPESLIAGDLRDGRLVQLGGAGWVGELKFSLFAASDLLDDHARALWSALCAPQPRQSVLVEGKQQV